MIGCVMVSRLLAVVIGVDGVGGMVGVVMMCLLCYACVCCACAAVGDGVGRCVAYWRRWQAVVLYCVLA